MANKPNGNLTGIKSAMLDRLKSLYDFKQGLDEFASFELLSELCACSGEINREISVYISRDGSIVDVSVGDSAKVSMPSMRLVRNEDRLCGVRCIHTHPSGDGRLSGVDLGTLRSMKLDCMAAVGVSDGKPTQLYAAYLGDFDEDTGSRAALVYGPMRPYKLPQKALIAEIFNSDDRFRSTTKEVEAVEQERAVLVGMDNDEGYDTLEELNELAKTAGALVVGKVRVRRRTIDNATYVGSGKANELSLMGSELEADLFIFDDELSAIQLRTLEETLGARVIDRTTLILDIFAARATSREGKLQVELAQMRYRLPRLIGQGQVLSRLGGGIGTRGPGEKKLEIDRRRIRRRVFELETELSEIEKQRGLRRESRKANRIPLVALVGYTNAGKSTMLNALTDSNVLAEDKLFATLDPVVRKITLSGSTEALLSDTVGFINKLPHDLVEAFKSTLEEVSNSDLILQVVDISCPYHEKQMRVVDGVLESLRAADIPRIIVFNKADAIPSGELPAESENRLNVSALRGTGIEKLLSAVELKLNSARTEVDILVPYSKYEAVSMIRDRGMLLSEEHTETGTRIRALLDAESIGQLRKILDF
ncbi:MAG TPA: GTPase HflX [Clostridiales bacterium]|nr:GTPase HflX [Clostridiales bacterium]